ncbi:MAG: SRPBCC family protein [Hyphomicrobiales bacterium]
MPRTLRNALIPSLAVALALALAAPGVARAAAPAATGDLVREAVVDGPVDLVWKLLTTKHGVESWLAPHADIDLKVGGKMRTHADEDGKLGDPNTFVGTILSLEPGRMLGVRVDQTPKDTPIAQLAVGTRYDILVDPVDKSRTRVRCIGRGLASGPAVYALRPLFDRGADAAFEELEKAVALRSTPKTK